MPCLASMAKQSLLLLFFFLINVLTLQPISALDFIFNGFNSSNISIYGITTLESNILALTNTSVRSMGHAFFPSKISTRAPNSSTLLPFYTSFIFSIATLKGFDPGHGFVFLFSPSSTMDGASPDEYLGVFNRTNDGNPDNHVLGIEFDVILDHKYNASAWVDAYDRVRFCEYGHVGVDVNSLNSIAVHTSGHWMDDRVDKFKDLKLNNGVNYQVWVDYSDSLLNVTMAPAGMRRPRMPLLSVFLNLSDVFLDEMYVGFSASTGISVQTHRILAWGFSNSNLMVGDELITSNLPSFVPGGSGNGNGNGKGFIVGISVAIAFMICCGFVIVLVLIKRRRKRNRDMEVMEEWEVEYWPHRITYQEIQTAAKGFSEENVIGVGGNGKIYKGVLVGGVEVAVKCISHESEEGMRGFWLRFQALAG